MGKSKAQQIDNKKMSRLNIGDFDGKKMLFI